VNRGYLIVDGRRVHVLAGGSGPALLLLQDLPLRVLDLRPLAAALSERYAVICMDVAGCGLSEPLAEPTLDAFAEDVVSVADAFELPTFAVYARGTAAAIGLRLRSRLGARVARLVLDDPRLVTAAEAADWFRWTDDRFTAEPSGAHLVRLWDHVRTECQFRPPYRQTATARIVSDMPTAEALTQRVVGWLCAGPTARDTRRAIVLDDGDDAAASGAHARVLPEPTAVASPAMAATAVASALEHASHAAVVDLRHWRAPRSADDGLVRTFVPVDGGDLHAYVSRSGSGRPVVVLHDPAGTSELVLSFGAPLAADRPVIALDLPGNGESDNTLGTDQPTSASYAAVVAQALDSLGLRDVDLIGRYSGGPVGMELAFMQPGRVRHLVQAGITVYAPDEARRLLASYTPTIAPDDHGGHLLLAWHIMKSQALYWPWFDQTRAGVVRGEPQLEPALIHRRVVDLLKCGDLYRKAYAALWTYPLAERLPQLDVPTLLCAPEWDPLYPHLGKAAAAGPHCRVATLPPRFGDWWRDIVPFLDDRAPAPGAPA
jgi:pimeloyl-ACP methyl ester carboxylesterase